jgi:hypothetical protein
VNGDVLSVTRRLGDRAGAVFLGFLLTFWSAGCLMIIWGFIKTSKIEIVFVAIPAFSMWVAGFVKVVYEFYGIETLTIGSDGIHYLASAIVPLRRRSIPFDELKGVAAFTADSAGSNRPPPILTVRLVTRGRPLDVCKGVVAREQLWLVSVLEQHLKTKAPHLKSPCVETQDRQVEVVQPGATIPPPPSDSRILMSTDSDGLLFRRRGTFNPETFAKVTFFNLFWNTGVGMIVFQLFQSFQWSLWLFLIPFEVAGLVVIFVWLSILTAPFQVESWNVGSDGLTSRYSVFGLGRTRRVESSDLSRLELRKNTDPVSDWYPALVSRGSNETPYSLTFVDRGPQDTLTIDNLTEGEARWISGHVAEQLKAALINARPSLSAAPAKAAALWDPDLDS